MGREMFGSEKYQQRPIVAKSSFSSPILYAPTHFVCLIYQHSWYTFSKIVPQTPLMSHIRIHLHVQPICFFQCSKVEHIVDMKTSQYAERHAKERITCIFISMQQQREYNSHENKQKDMQYIHIVKKLQSSRTNIQTINEILNTGI